VESTAAAIPEPATMLLLGAGLFGAFGLRKRFVKLLCKLKENESAKGGTVNGAALFYCAGGTASGFNLRCKKQDIENIIFIIITEKRPATSRCFAKETQEATVSIFYIFIIPSYFNAVLR